MTPRRCTARPSHSTWTGLTGAGHGLFLAPIAALLVGYGVSVPYNVFAMVAVWRAADRAAGERAWAEAARVAAVVGLAVLTLT